MDEILEAARQCEVRKIVKNVTVFVPEDGKWMSSGKKEKRSLESLSMDHDIKKDLIDDMEQFISSRDWYRKKGLPYRRGYLLYGEPGCGKSSVILALAGEFVDKLTLI